MVGEEQFIKHFPGAADTLGIRLHRHALTDLCDARRDQGFGAPHLDDADSARPERMGFFKITQIRNGDADGLCRFDDRRVLGYR